MATVITLTLPDSAPARVLPAMADKFPIPETVPGTPDYTQAQWTRLQIKYFLRDVVLEYERKLAHEDVNNTVLPDDSIVDVT